MALSNRATEAELLVEQLWDQHDDLDTVRMILEDALQVVDEAIDAAGTEIPGSD